MRTFLIVLFIVQFSFSYSQEVTVFYKEKRKAEYHKLRSYEGVYGKTKEELELINQKAATHENELMYYEYVSVLKVKEYKSIYYPQERQHNDTINSSITYGKEGKNVFISRETAKKDYRIVYSDQSIRKKISVEYAYGKEYLIEEDLQKQDWQFTEETKVILGFNCKKALFVFTPSSRFISESYGNPARKEPYFIEVWYTEDIPVNIGPLGYYGLPGLIIMIIDDNTKIVFDKLFYTLDGFEIKPPLIGEKISRDDLKNIPMQLFNKY